jgi:hypothetical protein
MLLLHHNPDKSPDANLSQLLREAVAQRCDASCSIAKQANGLLLGDGPEDWPDSDGSIWFIALAKEQSALVTHDGLHRISFG